MNTILLFCVILVSNQFVLASKKPDINALLFFAQQTTNNCKTPGLQCKDCQTIQYCSTTNLESLFEINCGDQSRLRPYCDVETNTCVKDKPAVCNMPESQFHCPGVGYYPDLEDCANYYICDEDKVATKMSCPIGSNWVQGDKTCTPAIYCRSYSPKLGQCKGKTNKLVTYAPDKNMYVLCLANGPILFQCPNKWEVFDEAEVTCKFECTQNGFFPDPSDPRKFFSCTKVGKGYESVSLECPEGYEFFELEAGQGICTFRTTTTTTTTEAPTTIEDLTTILEEHTERVEQEENNNGDEEIEEETNSRNGINEENHDEVIEEHNLKEVENNNEEEIVQENNLENNDEVHHTEENVNQSNDENNIENTNNSDNLQSENQSSNDHSQIEENHEEETHESEITSNSEDHNDYAEIGENSESQLF